MRRIIIIVMDSVGIGELPDAGNYKDEGSNTLGNIFAAIDGFSLPNLEMLGLGSIEGCNWFRYENPCGCFGRMAEKSPGKDTTTGHWEIAGVILENKFPVYPEGFPKEIVDEFEKAAHTKILGNIAASGTEIIKKLGQQHVMTGYPIVYTSADSVFQIAAHEDVIPVEKLYEMCQIARKILQGKHGVGRVIARPFAGTEGNFYRTERRKDFSLKPPQKTLLDFVTEAGYKVKAVGKIEDIFAGSGISESVHTTNNMDGVKHTLEFIKSCFDGIIFTNLVDFDMVYGHRNNVEGYAKALKEFDEKVPAIIDALYQGDVLIITADHGCDPTTPSTDHSREYVPLLVYGRNLRRGINLGTRSTFADVAATAAEYLGIGKCTAGTSFLGEVT